MKRSIFSSGLLNSHIQAAQLACHADLHWYSHDSRNTDDHIDAAAHPVVILWPQIRKLGERRVTIVGFLIAAAGCCLDTTPGRVFYFYHDCARFWKYVRPVRRV